MPRFVFIDPDGTAHDYLGVIVSHPTGIVYIQQCAGVETLMRSLEGYLVPVGGITFDPAQGSISSQGLTVTFHENGGCTYGGEGIGDPPRAPRLPPDRISQLRAIVESIPYWTALESGETSRRGQLRLDETRLAEIVEAWVPVMTPEGCGILTWPNCD